MNFTCKNLEKIQKVSKIQGYKGKVRKVSYNTSSLLVATISTPTSSVSPKMKRRTKLIILKSIQKLKFLTQQNSIAGIFSRNEREDGRAKKRKTQRKSNSVPRLQENEAYAF